MAKINKKESPNTGAKGIELPRKRPTSKPIPVQAPKPKDNKSK